MRATPLLAPALKSIRTKAAVSTSRFITSVSKSSWNSKGFHFSQSRRKHCDTAVALWSKHLIQISFVTTRSSLRSKRPPN